jgi:hypothetical protein
MDNHKKPKGVILLYSPGNLKFHNKAKVCTGKIATHKDQIPKG